MKKINDLSHVKPLLNKREIVCQICGLTADAFSSARKYCKECARKLDREQKDDWTKKNIQHKRDFSNERATRIRESGKPISRNNAISESYMSDRFSDQEFSNLVIVKFPFDIRFSKNAILNLSRNHGRVFIRRDIQALYDDLTWRIKQENAGATWFEGKIWIDLFIEKPNARSDAINVVDAVCDVVKKAVGVDDRWFAFRGLDWSIVKDDPHITLGIAQTVKEHHRACMYCGVIKPLQSEFIKKKTDRLGYERECKKCTEAAKKQ